MAQTLDPNLQQAVDLLAVDELAVDPLADRLGVPTEGAELTVDQRLALAQAHALISIARSLRGIEQDGFTTH